MVPMTPGTTDPRTGKRMKAGDANWTEHLNTPGSVYFPVLGGEVRIGRCVPAVFGTGC